LKRNQKKKSRCTRVLVTQIFCKFKWASYKPAQGPYSVFTFSWFPWHEFPGITSFPARHPPFNLLPLHITCFPCLLVNLIPFFQSFGRFILLRLFVCPLIVDLPSSRITR
jgi:hypothetical protein